MPRGAVRRARRAAPLRAPRRPWRFRLALLLLLAILAAGAALHAVSRLEVPPRELAPYLRHRASGHAPLLVDAVDGLAGALEALDRGPTRSALPLDLRIGARGPRVQPATPATRRVAVGTPEDALRALREALPGDAIEFEPGTYRFDAGLEIDRPGAAGAPIALRAGRAGDVTLAFAAAEAFRVSAPYRTFENLVVRGVCARHADCEHAFHVVGGAHHVVIAGNAVSDFNAHIKVNGERGRFPDDGTIEANTLVNASARETASPVTPIDIVGASRWSVRGNLIADFVKAQGNRISYGAFAKGGGDENRFERNVVLCEWKLRGAPGWRVGLSLGGGGSSIEEFCRDRTCALEQERSVIEANLVAGCSDDGVYVNRAAGSRIVHNTLIDTGGIVVRFPESSALVEGNLVDGTIRQRDGALLHADDNVDIGMAALYAGRHAPRALFRDPLALDLRWRQAPPRRAGAVEVPDLCGTARPAVPAQGAFEDFAACLRTPEGPLSSRP